MHTITDEKIDLRELRGRRRPTRSRACGARRDGCSDQYVFFSARFSEPFADVQLLGRQTGRADVRPRSCKTLTDRSRTVVRERRKMRAYESGSPRSPSWISTPCMLARGGVVARCARRHRRRGRHPRRADQFLYGAVPRQTDSQSDERCQRGVPPPAIGPSPAIARRPCRTIRRSRCGIPSGRGIRCQTLVDTALCERHDPPACSTCTTRRANCPIWPLASGETGTMIGYHAVSVIADAYLKGIRGYDAGKALDAMIRSSNINKKGSEYYVAQGYHSRRTSCRESVSCALEYAYDDWAVARMARGDGPRPKRARRVRRAGRSTTSVSSTAATRFFRGRQADGRLVGAFRRIHWPDATIPRLRRGSTASSRRTT